MTLAPTGRAPADPPRYAYRLLTLTELPLVNDLYNRCYGTTRPLAEAEWLYKHHPYGEPLIQGAFGAGDELAGVLPAMAHKFLWSGREEIAYQLIDAVVAPEHRNRGIFGHLVKLICETAAEKDFVVFAFPNDQSMSVYRKTGLLQSVGTCEARLKVLSWPAYLRYRLGRASQAGAAHVAPGGPTRVRHGEISLVPIDRFGSDFDDIHRELRRVVTSFTLRRRDFLNWRYFESAQRRYRVALIERAGQPLGYVALRMIDRIAHVMDVFVSPEPRVARVSVRLLTRWAKQLGAIAIFFTASRENVVQSAFARNGFLLRKKGGEITMDPRSLGRLAALQERPVARRDFYYVMGDGDFF